MRLRFFASFNLFDSAPIGLPSLCGKPCWHHTPEGLKERIKAEIINLIKNEDVTEFLVGELGGYEKDAYDTVLEVQKDYPNIRIILLSQK